MRTTEQIVDEMFTESNIKKMVSLGLVVSFGKDKQEIVWLQQNRRRVLKELNRFVEKGGTPIGFVGLHEAEMNGIIEGRQYYKVLGGQWETDEHCMRFAVGPPEDIQKLAGDAGVQHVPDKTDILIVPWAKSEKRH